jgi:hypothetical protein
MFKATWLYDDLVNGPSFYNQQIEEDLDDNVWEASNKNWDVYFTLENPITEDEFCWDYDIDQWRMEQDIQDRWAL